MPSALVSQLVSQLASQLMSNPMSERASSLMSNHESALASGDSFLLWSSRLSFLTQFLGGDIIFTLSRSELPLWRDLPSQLSIRHWVAKRCNETEQRGTKRHEGSFPLATPGMALGYLSRAEETVTSNPMSYRVPKEGCAASSCKSFSPRTECAARLCSTTGKTSTVLPIRALIQHT